MPFLMGAPFPVAAKPFDPSLLSLTGWLRAPYDATDVGGYVWRGTDSANPVGSGINDAAQMTFGGAKPIPSVGPSLHGFTVARFNGSDQVLVTSQASSFFDVGPYLSAFTLAMLFRVNSVSLNNATAIANHPIMCGANYHGGIFVASNGDGTARIMVQKDGFYGTSLTIPSVAIGEWLLLRISRSEDVTAGNGTMTIDAGTGALTATGTYGMFSDSEPMCFGGTQTTSNPHAEFDMADWLTMNVPDGFTRAQMLSYVNARYALSLE